MCNTNINLNNEVVILTGCTKGIGGAIANKLLELNMKALVYTTYLDLSQIQYTRFSHKTKNN